MMYGCNTMKTTQNEDKNTREKVLACCDSKITVQKQCRKLQVGEDGSAWIVDVARIFFTNLVVNIKGSDLRKKNDDDPRQIDEERGRKEAEKPLCVGTEREEHTGKFDLSIALDKGKT